MPPFIYSVVAGDVKPIAFQNVASSTGAAIAGASCVLYNHATGAQIGTSQAMTVNGSTITSPQFTWAVGTYTLAITITFTDGIVDHTLAAFVQVAAVPT